MKIGDGDNTCPIITGKGDMPAPADIGKGTIPPRNISQIILISKHNSIENLVLFTIENAIIFVLIRAVNSILNHAHGYYKGRNSGPVA